MAEEATPARPAADDEELLRRAELALAQLNNQHGLSPEQASTLTAIRLRLEGKERASLEDLLEAGKDLGGRDPLAEAMERQTRKPSFEQLVDRAGRKPKSSLDDLL
jgi:hypothetical protein